MQPKPKFVAISDIHFNLNNLQLSSQALSAALSKAEQLEVPLVIAGDLNDTKAIIRGEVANSIIEILAPALVKIYILVGNHDLLNEKGSAHGLNYLRPYAEVIDVCRKHDELPGVFFIPYQSDATHFKAAVDWKASSGDIIVCHQGVKGALMGDYVQDKSAIDVEILKGYPTISGHYHEHQTIGSLTYIGNPFTMSFGEASHGPKGFLVVNEDGRFTREILNLRKHVVYDWQVGEGMNLTHSPKDLLWVKVRGPKSHLDGITKAYVSKLLQHHNFKFDKIVTEGDDLEEIYAPRSDRELLDALIEGTSESNDQKTTLKALWRELLS